MFKPNTYSNQINEGHSMAKPDPHLVVLMYARIFLNTHEKFKISELEEYVRKKTKKDLGEECLKGCLNVGPGRSLREWVYALVDMGLLEEVWPGVYK